MIFKYTPGNFSRFIFIMGVSLAISFQSLRSKNISRINVFRKIIRRTLILFALGLLLNKGKELDKVIIYVSFCTDIRSIIRF